jgi:hypothetical protein
MDLLVPTSIQCPYCLEIFEVLLDTSQEEATLIEDCTVCCRPIEIEYAASPGDIESVSVQRG